MFVVAMSYGGRRFAAQQTLAAVLGGMGSYVRPVAAALQREPPMLVSLLYTCVLAVNRHTADYMSQLNQREGCGPEF
jgi:hypothetical protein